MRLLRSHGISRDKSLMTREAGGAWYYQQVGLGFNYRMTEMQAALGISQMLRLDEFVKKRHIIQERYDLLLNDLPVIRPYQDKDNYSSFHLYPIQIDLNKVNLKTFEPHTGSGASSMGFFAKCTGICEKESSSLGNEEKKYWGYINDINCERNVKALSHLYSNFCEGAKSAF